METIEQEAPEIAVDDLVAEHGPFLLTKTGIVATRVATFEEWSAATEWAQLVEKASPFWVGDLIEYGQHRYGEKYTQVLESSSYAEQTVKNATYVARAIPQERRRPAVPFSHHAEVAALPPAEQDEWLDKCENEGLTREQLRIQIRASKASSSGTSIELWLMVKCNDVTDQSELADRLRLEGRSVKMTSNP